MIVSIGSNISGGKPLRAWDWGGEMCCLVGVGMRGVVEGVLIGVAVDANDLWIGRVCRCAGVSNKIRYDRDDYYG